MLILASCRVFNEKQCSWKKTQVIYLTCIILYKFFLINEKKIKEGKLHAMSDDEQDYRKFKMESTNYRISNLNPS